MWKPDELLDRDVLDRDGDRIGRIERVYVDAQSGAPTFVAIHTGLLSRSPSVVPLAGAAARGDAVLLPLERDRVKGAPAVEPAGRNGGLSPGQEHALHTFYGVSPQTGTFAGGDAPEQRGTPRPPASDAPADDDAMTRSEERLRVHTEEQPQVRARLRKHVVTENVQVTVPVTWEEFRVEYVPLTEEPDAPSAEPLTLHAERVVVRTESVPTERVRLTTDRVTEEQTVTGDVRKERIELSGGHPEG